MITETIKHVPLNIIYTYLKILNAKSHIRNKQKKKVNKWINNQLTEY